MSQGVILLSGGMDSTAALCWAKQRYDLKAIGFDYGQPNRDQELTRAGQAARALGVPFVTLALADALRPAGLLREVPAHEPEAMGIHRAFVPGRNLLFLVIAASRASGWFPNGTIDLVIGCCKEDATGFPDCRVNTLSALNDALNRGMAREYCIQAPWIDRTKEQILYAIKPDKQAIDLVAQSWSCYRNDGPCGECTPCVLRAKAFASQDIEDRSNPCRMTGGDPGREVRS